MSESRDEWARGVMSGADRSPRATLLRVATTLAEPVYAGGMRVRNALYDNGVFKAARLGRPVVSVGNITTGGTGKTPVVRWLAGKLLDRRPAILLRGYRVGESAESDEREVLARALGERVVVEAGPSRVESAARVLAGHPDVGMFLLDDGFQHRKVHRDFDLVLINATDPFGFGRVLPRGLLREPLAGLARASAVLVTRADQASAGALEEIERTIRRHNPGAPIYRATHAHVGLRGEAGLCGLDELGVGRFFAFAGIGNPGGLHDQIRGHAGFAGHRWFADHHDYAAGDLERLELEARQAGATCLVTTEKDWVKVSRVTGPLGLPVFRLELEVRFLGDDESRLLAQVSSALGGGG